MALVKRAQSFDDALRALEDDYPGVRDAVDGFAEALKVGDSDLPIRPSEESQRVQRLDDPSLGPAGRGRFCVNLHSKTVHDVLVFTLIDIWPRTYDLPLAPPD
jgi:hypothetical protein